MTDPERTELSELRETAKALGIDGADRKGADELRREIQEGQTDSGASPTNPEWEEDGPRDDVAGDG